jgi:hypothetical protein
MVLLLSLVVRLELV